jgi:outer membrane protein assembly factor BamB
VAAVVVLSIPFGGCYARSMQYRRDGQDAPLIVAFAGHVFALDPTTGTRRWQYDGAQGVTVRVAVSERHVYTLSGGNLTCLDVRTGSPVWRAASAAVGVNGTLVLQGDLLFVGAAGEVACYDLTGQKVWHETFKGMGKGAVALGFVGNVAQADIDA